MTRLPGVSITLFLGLPSVFGDEIVQRKLLPELIPASLQYSALAASDKSLPITAYMFLLAWKMAQGNYRIQSSWHFLLAKSCCSFFLKDVFSGLFHGPATSITVCPRRAT